MTNELQIFNFNATEIRGLSLDGQPALIAKDVAKILGYAKPADAVRRHVPSKFKGVSKIKTPGGVQEVIVITEPGVYKLMFSSKLPTAEKFTNWVTSEVLPSIRKTGGYQLQQSTELNETLSSFESRIKQLEEANLLSAVDYNYIGKLVSNRVTTVGRNFDFEITPRQRVELNRDLNEGISRIAGVEKRTQLQAKDYEMVVNFIREWEPSTATLMIIQKH